MSSGIQNVQKAVLDPSQTLIRIGFTRNGHWQCCFHSRKNTICLLNVQVGNRHENVYSKLLILNCLASLAQW
jgi:hypothetical protein